VQLPSFNNNLPVTAKQYCASSIQRNIVTPGSLKEHMTHAPTQSKCRKKQTTKLTPTVLSCTRVGDAGHDVKRSIPMQSVSDAVAAAVLTGASQSSKPPLVHH